MDTYGRDTTPAAVAYFDQVRAELIETVKAVRDHKEARPDCVGGVCCIGLGPGNFIEALDDEQRVDLLHVALIVLAETESFAP